MGKPLKTIVCSALSVPLLFGVLFMGQARGTYAAAAEGDYYAPVTAAEGEALLGQLHDLITTTHTSYISYKACKEKVPITDPGLDGNGVLEFYTHESLTVYVGDVDAAGSWNREHVWPQSLSSLWGEEGGGSDLHHIRPSEKQMNSTRGNDKFGEVTNGGEVYSKKAGGENSQLGGYHAGGVFEPLDSVKGDVARIVMYLYTHYNTYSNVGGTTNGSGGDSVERFFGTLHFTDVVSASSEAAAVEMLLEWNKLDAVDEIETRRNEEAFKIQGNRNPFIDHPEYADAVWKNGPTTPSGSETPNDPNPPQGPVETAGQTVTITLDSFTLTEGYGFKKWSSGGVGGLAFLYGGSSDYPADQGMQFNKSKASYYLASDLPTAGAIRSVTVKSHAGTADRPWKLLTSDAPYGEVAGRPTDGNDRGTKTVTSEGVTWTVSGTDTYFALTYELDAKSGAAYLDSIVIEYEKETSDAGQGEQPPAGGTEEKKGCGSVIGPSAFAAGGILLAAAAAVVFTARRKD